MLKRIQLFISKQLFNNKGMAIAQVLVIVVFMVIVSAGIMTMIQNSEKDRQKQNVLATLQELKRKIEFLAQDPSSWANTISITTGTYNSSARFNNIRAKQAVDISVAGSFSNPEKIILFNSNGDVEMDLLGPSNTTGNGFTVNGTPCANFNSVDGSGNDECPISYRLLVGFECPSAAVTTCKSPRVKVAGRLIYNPRQNSALYKLKTMIPQSIDQLGINLTNLPAMAFLKYEAWVERTLYENNRSFVIASQFVSSSGVAGCATNGAGTCTTSVATHPLTLSRGWVKTSPSSLVAISGDPSVSLPTEVFKFNETGFYSCTIQAPAFATDLFEIQLYDSASVVAKGSVIAGKWQQLTAKAEAKFEVNATNLNYQYTVRQRCQTVPGPTSFDASVATCTLGVIPSTGYSGRTDIVTVNCFKFDKPQ